MSSTEFGSQARSKATAWIVLAVAVALVIIGGVIAELFDELLGSVNILTGRAGMTGTLTVRYRRPTPLLTPLDLVARQTGSEGRKIFAWGGIYHEGELTAEAEGIFIEVGAAKMLEIISANADEAEGDVVDPELEELRGAQAQ
jgi:hypothetical protein